VLESAVAGVTPVTLAHLSDLHFGRDAQLDQIEALEALIPELRPDAVVISGDLSQRARHGELQRALAFTQTVGRASPTLVIPGNHDVQWWRSPFGILGSAPRYEKWRRYFGPELTPTLELPGAVLAGVLTSHGVALGSLTWNLNDLAIKGHLPAPEARRVARYFAAAPADAARIVVMHHNILRGAISQRMGLARWRQAQQLLRSTGADLILCGHDHQEGCGQVENVIAVSTSGTHTDRCRGERASAFNLVSIDASSINIQHHRWDGKGRLFVPSDLERLGRVRHQ
jgi:3',5'-cyclic AMP phosphodiesterase CpdA